MVIDFAGCFIIETACKALFADLEPKPLITRGSERRVKRRALQLQEAVQAELEKARSEVEKKAQ
jgi:cation-transporting ATPase 13A1